MAVPLPQPRPHDGRDDDRGALPVAKGASWWLPNERRFPGWRLRVLPRKCGGSVGILCALGSPGQRLDELAERGDTADPGVAAVQAAGQTGRLATVGEGVVPVDEDRRRAPHPEPLG